MTSKLKPASRISKDLKIRDLVRLVVKLDAGLFPRPISYPAYFDYNKRSEDGDHEVAIFRTNSGLVNQPIFYRVDIKEDNCIFSVIEECFRSDSSIKYQDYEHSRAYGNLIGYEVLRRAKQGGPSQ